GSYPRRRDDDEPLEALDPRDRAEEALADADFIDGRFEAARPRYASLAARSLDEDAARTLAVKELATHDEAARPTVSALLLGDELHGPDLFVGGVALGEWKKAAAVAGHGSALARYLAGRNLVSRGFYAEGAKELDASLALGPETPRIAREAVRQRAIAACALSDRAALASMRSRIESPDDPFAGSAGEGRRESILRMIARCSQ